jgi:hypothetical protein
MQLSTNEAGQVSEYRLTFGLASAGQLGSVLIQFCANDPLPETPCVAPAGFDASAATLDDQAGPTGFSISGASTANELILTRTPANEPVGQARYDFGNIINPSTPGPFFIRLLTYATDDASGPSSNYGGIALYIMNSLSVSTTVPPYLIFCTGTTIGGLNCVNASGDFIDFGELSSKRASSGTSQMLVATNAEVGYTITMGGTTLTSGSNAITGLGVSDVSRPGTPQFGLNLRANGAPSVGSDPTGPGLGTPTANYNLPNVFHFAAGDVVASSFNPEDVRKYTAAYIVNVPSTQNPGIYVSTLTYVCLANF